MRDSFIVQNGAQRWGTGWSRVSLDLHFLTARQICFAAENLFAHAHDRALGAWRRPSHNDAMASLVMRNASNGEDPMMMKRWGAAMAVLTVLTVLTLGGCASVVTSHVTAFQDWPGGAQHPSYAFDPTPEQKNDLENQAYEQLVEAALRRHGFELATADHAMYAVRLQYGQRDTTAYAPQVAYPYSVFGPGFGVGYGPDFGGWGRRGWGPGPWWGPPPVVDVPYAARESALTVFIADKKSGQELYKVTAQSTGNPTSLVVVMPYLVRSALFDFPLPNGTVRDVKVGVAKDGKPVPAP